MVSKRHIAILKRIAIFIACFLSLSYFIRPKDQQWIVQWLGLEPSDALDDSGLRVGSPTLVSKPQPEARDMYTHTFPYDGTLVHYATAFHPAKALGATNYIMESLWFIAAEDSYKPWAIQAFISGNWTRFAFECEFDGENYGGMMYPQDGRDEYLRVECAVPVWARQQLSTEATDLERHEAFVRLSKSQIAINVWVWLDEEDIMDDETYILEQGGEENLRRIRLARHEFGDWITPPTSNELSICTAPVRMSDQTTLTDLIEWRTYHYHQGFTAVHWYSRDPSLEPLVERINAALHSHDTFQLAPVSVPHYAHQESWYRGYADQSVLQADCLLRWGHADAWQGYFDIDEYLFVKDVPSDTAIKERLNELDPEITTVSVYQVYFGGERTEDAPRDEMYPDFPRDAFSRWQPEHLLGGARYCKALHRTAGTESLWVHSALSIGAGHVGITEERLDGNLTGTLQFLHSRRYMYQDMEFPLENVITLEHRHYWDKMLDRLRSVQNLTISVE